MRKKAKPTGWVALTPFILYLEDIRDLHEIVSEVCDEVRYETDDYLDISGPDQLAGLGARTVRELTITGLRARVQQISVRFSPSGARATATTDSNEMFGAIEKIKRVCWRHTRDWSPANLWILPVPIGFAILIVVSPYHPSAWALLLAAVVILGIAGYAISDVRTHYTTIYTVPEHDAPGFWQRNRDNVILGLIFLVIGLIATYFVGQPK